MEIRLSTKICSCHVKMQGLKMLVGSFFTSNNQIEDNFQQLFAAAQRMRKVPVAGCGAWARDAPGLHST